MQVKVYECGISNGETEREYVGTFSLDSIRENNMDGVGEEELDRLERDLKETGKGMLDGFVGLFHEYEVAPEPEETPATPRA